MFNGSCESISALLPQLIGGSADLSGSNNTKTNNSKMIIQKILTVIYSLWSKRTWYGCDNEWISSLRWINTLWGTFLIFLIIVSPQSDYRP